MNTNRTVLLALAAVSFLGLPAIADDYTDPPAPLLGISALSNGQKRVTFPAYPSADLLRMLGKGSILDAWLEDLSGVFSNCTWTAAGSNAFHRLEVTPLGSNAVLTATALNKLAYGPTPTLIDRLLQATGTNSASAWINEKLNPESIIEG